MEKFIVRRADLEDAPKIWEIRNNPTARRESLNTEEIPLDSHLAWFENKYSEKSDNVCFVIEEEGFVIGYCRLDLNNNNYLASIAIDPNHHGKGLGTYLLGESLRQFGSKKNILATVKKDNPASLRIFQKNGFIPISNDLNSIYLERS